METATQALSSHQIAGQISAARDLIIGLEQEAHDLSYPAVSGDQKAVASLGTIRAQIRQANEDIAVLELAKGVAISKEAAAEQAEDQAHRARHMTIAREKAAAIVDLARRVDNLLVDFKAVLADLDATELAIWNALRGASTQPSSAIVGQRNIGHFAIALLTAFTNGSDRFRQPPAVADIAARAWSDLLGGCDV